MFQKIPKDVRLKFSTISKEAFNGVNYLFSVGTDGKASDKGFFISISGDAIDSGELKLERIELHRLKGVKFEVVKYGLKKIEKKDGGFAYQLSLKNFYIPQKESFSQTLLKFNGDREKANLSRIENEIQFKLSISYTSDKDSEMLVGVFPYENIISGACTQWVDVRASKE